LANPDMNTLSEQFEKYKELQIEVFSVVTPCSVAVGYQRFRDRIATCSSEMLISYRNTTGRHNSQELHLKHHRRESLKTRQNNI